MKDKGERFSGKMVGVKREDLTKDETKGSWMYSYYKVESESRSVVSDSVTPWTEAHQANLCVGFSR